MIDTMIPDWRHKAYLHHAWPIHNVFRYVHIVFRYVHDVFRYVHNVFRYVQNKFSSVPSH